MCAAKHVCESFSSCATFQCQDLKFKIDFVSIHSDFSDDHKSRYHKEHKKNMTDFKTEYIEDIFKKVSIFTRLRQLNTH